MVNSAPRAGIARFLRLPVTASVLAVAAALLLPSLAYGASWQWSGGAGGRERIVITLDSGQQEQATVRTSPTSLDVQLDAPAGDLSRSGTAPSGGLVTGMDVQDNTLRLNLNDPAFGYIVQRRAGSITLEIFRDPLGARWQPSDTRSVALPPNPASPVAPANPTAQISTTPQASPATGTTPPATTPAATAAPQGQSQPQTQAQASPSAASTPQTAPDQADQASVQAPGQTPVQAQTQTPPQQTSTQPTAQPAPQQAGTQAAQAPQTPQTQQPGQLAQAGPAVSEAATLPVTQGGPPVQEQAMPGTTPVVNETRQAGQAPELVASVNAQQAQAAVPLTDTGSVVTGQAQEAITTPPVQGQAARSEQPGVQVTTVHTPAGQGQIVVPPTSGRDVRINVQVNQTPPTGSTTTVVAGNGTPAGMPGSQPGSQAPLSVSSGASLPVQPDPPSDVLPSADALGAITQRIESVPVLPDQQGQVRGSMNGALLSSPAAPPPSSEEVSLGAPVQEIPGAAAAPSGTVNVDVNATGQAPAGNVSVDVNTTGQAPAGVTDVQVTGSAPVQVQADIGAPPFAAEDPAPVPDIVPQPGSDRVVEESGSGLRARFNPGGPESWPEEEALSTAPATPSTSPAGQGAGGTVTIDLPKEVTGSLESLTLDIPKAEEPKKEGEAPTEPEILYVDEQGNPVPKPLDVNAKMAEARQFIQSMMFDSALEVLDEVKTAPLPPEKREEVLYLISDATTGLYNGKWLEGYEPIVSATSEAMNANLRSPQVPRALERLGMINLRTDNQQDAAGYFAVLRRQFPLDPQVPEVYNALGRDQLKRGQYAEAVQSYQVVMQEYPESPGVKEAARFMAEALYRQGHYERALTIIDFVDRRWPRIYIEDPEYLTMVADTQFRRGRLDDALQTYWIYYNLLPGSPTNDQLLLNMGTIYLMLGDKDSSNSLYNELLRRFPDSQYAPLAVLRQGEEGIFEGNLSVEDLFAMFSRPNLSTLPEIAYQRILNDYPQSAEAETAALRMAAWKLWNREYSEAMNQAEAFLQQHADSLYAPRADEILLRAIAVELALDLEEQNYERILSRWERFPQMRGAYANMDDDLRVALARAHINRGEEDEGFALLKPFLERGQDPTFGEYVYKLNLARALRTEDWQEIISLGEKVADWNLSQDERNQLVYAMAIGRENMNQGQEAIPLWQQLYTRDDIPLYQKAYANYFMARDAERRRNINEAYELNKETLSLFNRLAIENPERADQARVQETLVALMDVTEVANRFAEALEWADQYAPFVPESSPEFAAYRFRLARLYRKMGDLLRWQHLLEDIIEREPDSVFGQAAASELRTHQVARDLSRFTPDS